MDTCGFAKDNYYYYKSWWTDEPVVHVFPHWNWPDKVGENIEVWCFSNCEEIELVLNGRTIDRKEMQQNGHLEWFVPYEPGTLTANGFKNGKLILSDSVVTTGKPAGIALEPDRDVINADGSDVAVVTVRIIDDEGKTVPKANNLVMFEAAGGDIIGVGNGDPSCHEPDKASQRSAFNGLCQVIVQSRKEPGAITLKANAEGLEPAAVTIQASAKTVPMFVRAGDTQD
jgi:beta-galactosidase